MVDFVDNVVGSGVDVLLLGAAQDGGYPQFGCVCDNCRSCYDGHTPADSAVSLAILDSNCMKWWLVDATPQLCQQWTEFARLLCRYELAGVILTHAHAGHYPGLLYFGKEGKNTSRIPVYASSSMHAFLKANEPWAVMYRNENLVQVDVDDGLPISLSALVTVTPQSVVHRADFTDTFAFVIQGPNKRLFFCPDIDSWDGLTPSLGCIVDNNDVLLLDATFYDDNELSGRDMSKIPHPRVTTTVEMLAAHRNLSSRSIASKEVVLIHINHSNRLWTDRQTVNELKQQRIQVGRKGMTWAL
jgi:pyrroloquinoline quinone biosynthesis protein B